MGPSKQTKVSPQSIWIQNPVYLICSKFEFLFRAPFRRQSSHPTVHAAPPQDFWSKLMSSARQLINTVHVDMLIVPLRDEEE